MLIPTDISPDGVRRIAGFEGTVLHLYRDVVGIETVCTGHVTLPGEDWSSVTVEKCQATLGRDLSRFVQCVLSKITAPISQAMLDALVSLVFNIGCGGWATSSVLRFLNAQEYEQAAQAFKLWCNAQVKQKDGSFIKKPVLLGRRVAEGQLFSAGIPEVMGATRIVLPSVEESVRYGQSTLFDLVKDLPSLNRPAIESETEDHLTDDGRLVVIPPEAEEQLAA